MLTNYPRTKTKTMHSQNAYTNLKILIFDEPYSSLDLQNTLAIENLLNNLSHKYIIIISKHNMDQAKRISDRILFIEDKKLVENDEI